MIYRILADSITTVAKTSPGQLSNQAFNGLLFSINVGGTGHTEADFDSIKFQVSIRQEKGNDIPLVENLSFRQICKIADLAGGFSMDLAAGANGRYVAWLPTDRVIVKGDDKLEASAYFPGDATATYGVTVAAVDLKAGIDWPRCYKVIAGIGSRVLVRNVEALYYLTDPSGADLVIETEQGRSYTLKDYDIVDFANATGEIESYEEIGVPFSDNTGVTQDIYVNAPSGSTLVAAVRYFDADRMARRTSDDSSARDAYIAGIVARGDDKALVISALQGA